jgi:hypothetical protein
MAGIDFRVTNREEYNTLIIPLLYPCTVNSQTDNDNPDVNSPARILNESE